MKKTVFLYIYKYGILFGVGEIMNLYLGPNDKVIHDDEETVEVVEVIENVNDYSDIDDIDEIIDLDELLF